MPKLDGKIAVITVEALGIGLATAKVFVKGRRARLHHGPQAGRTRSGTTLLVRIDARPGRCRQAG